MRPRLLPLLLVVPLAAGCAPPTVPDFDVLLVSIDGTPPELLREEWERLPTLRSIVQTGSLQLLEVEGVTDTMASHARLLTGLGPEATGVVSAFHWAPIPAGVSLPERLEQRYGANLRRYFVVNKPHMLGFDSEDEPFYYAAQACDLADNRQMIADITPEMIRALRTTGDLPFFAFFHWAGVDQAGHEHGERSPEQRAALRDVDGQLAVVLAEIEAMGRMDRTRIYVTTDHGFDPGGDSHYNDAADVFVLTNDPLIGSGTWSHQLTWTLLQAYDALEPGEPPVAPL